MSSSLRFALFSDLHLDVAFAWAGAVAARRRRQALRDTLLVIVDRANELEVDALLCGGDLFEHERVSPDTAEFLRSTFEKAHPLRVFIAPGNHDWYGPASAYRRVQWSANVHIFSEPTLQPVTLSDGFTLWGAAHIAPANTDNFLSEFHVDRGGVNVALFHGSERSLLPRQESEKQPHAPFEAHEIALSGLRHAFLGHFHSPADEEFYTYPGNPDPLTFGEQGERALVIAEITEDGILHRERQRVAVTRVHDLELDITGCTNRQDVRGRAESLLRARNGMARITVVGDLEPSIDLLPQDIAEVGSHLEAVLVRFGKIGISYDFETLAAEPTVRGQFVRDVRSGLLDPDLERRVVVTGLRALEGREDLEVL